MAEMNYKNLEANQKDPETLSAEDEKLCRMLGSLKRVEAPNDFDFRVRARIAGASPAGYRAPFLPVLRYVLPLGAVLLVLSGFVFNSLYFTGVQGVPTAAENTFQPPAAEKQLAKSTLIENKIENNPVNISPPSDARNAAAVVPVKNKKAATEIAARFTIEKFAGKVKTKTAAEELNPDGAGGTRLNSLTPPKQIITPPGINLGNVNKTTMNLPDFVTARPLTAKEVLSQLGIETAFENESWKVLSVRQNSPAERSGIKTGDAVQAIDGEKLTDKPMQNKRVEGKKLIVRRGVQKIEISLNN